MLVVLSQALKQLLLNLRDAYNQCWGTLLEKAGKDSDGGYQLTPTQTWSGCHSQKAPTSRSIDKMGQLLRSAFG